MKSLRNNIGFFIVWCKYTVFCRFRVPELGVHSSGSWRNMRGAGNRGDIALFRLSRTQQGTGTAPDPLQPGLITRCMTVAESHVLQSITICRLYRMLFLRSPGMLQLRPPWNRTACWEGARPCPPSPSTHVPQSLTINPWEPRGISKKCSMTLKLLSTCKVIIVMAKNLKIIEHLW